MGAVNLQAKPAKLQEHWSPRVVSTFNGHEVMVVKAKGEFSCHSHPDTDDFFLVITWTTKFRSSPPVGLYFNWSNIKKQRPREVAAPTWWSH